jgi:hypothetical protein
MYGICKQQVCVLLFSEVVYAIVVCALVYCVQLVYTWRARGPVRVNTTIMGFRATSYAVLILEASFEDLPVVFLAF